MHHKTRKYGTFTLYRRLLAESLPYWPHVLGFLLLRLCATPLALLTPLPLKLAVDSVIGSKPLPQVFRTILPANWLQAESTLLILLASLVVIFALLTLVHRLVTEMLKTYVGERLTIEFRSRLFRHVQQLSLSYHDRQGTSDSVYRIQYDAPAIQSIVIEGVIPLASAVAMLAGMLFVTWRVSPRLSLVAVTVCPPLLLMTALFRRRLRRQWRQVKNLESSAQSIVQEVLGAVRVVKAFSRETHEHQRFELQSRTGMTARLRAALQESCYGVAVGVITACGTAAVLFMGVRDVRSGALSLGNLLLVMAYLGKLYDPIKTLGKQLATREKSFVSAERAFSLLDESPEVPQRPDARSLQRARGHVSFRDVTFAYGDGSTVLRQVSFDAPAGTRVGIVCDLKQTLVALTGMVDGYNPGLRVQGCVAKDRAGIASLLGASDVLLVTPSAAERLQLGRSQVPVIPLAFRSDARSVEQLAALIAASRPPAATNRFRSNGQRAPRHR